jgi:hypothetical protein
MKRSHLIIVCLAAIVAGGLSYFYAGSSVPPGQPPLMRLNAGNFSELRSAFNAAQDSVRVIALLSPT